MESRSRDREAGLVVLNGGLKAHEAAGKVWLVGAGPGDPELLTRKAERILRVADVVVYDRLVGEGVLAMAAPGARKLYVGKRKSSHSVPQADLNDLLVALAREGLQVVRLKGGDPFMFGRGGEELAACRAAGVECEVAPGVSAALAAAASTGAPLTHRGLAQAVTFVTGHAAVDKDGAAGEPDLDWAALARPNQTVVVYMGLSTAPTIARRLMAAGRAGSTPVLLVENASRPQERRALCTLAGLPGVARGFAGPAVMVIGEVAALAQVEPALRSSPLRGMGPTELVEGPLAAAAHLHPQSAEFILRPAEGRTRGLAAPPEGKQLGASRRVRA